MRNFYRGVEQYVGRIYLFFKCFHDVLILSFFCVSLENRSYTKTDYDLFSLLLCIFSWFLDTRHNNVNNRVLVAFLLSLLVDRCVRIIVVLIAVEKLSGNKREQRVIFVLIVFLEECGTLAPHMKDAIMLSLEII